MQTLINRKAIETPGAKKAVVAILVILWSSKIGDDCHFFDLITIIKPAIAVIKAVNN